MKKIFYAKDALTENCTPSCPYPLSSFPKTKVGSVKCQNCLYNHFTNSQFVECTFEDGMEKQKRYKLVMPQMLTLKQFIVLMNAGLNDLYKSDGDIYANWHPDIPKEWLHEVKEQSPARKWFKNRFISNAERDFKDVVIEAFEAGQNEHKETITCAEAWGKYNGNWANIDLAMRKNRFEAGWEHCKKSHNLK